MRKILAASASVFVLVFAGCEQMPTGLDTTDPQGTVPAIASPEGAEYVNSLPFTAPKPSALASTASSIPGVDVVGDRSTFNASGDITYNYGYEDFGTQFSFPGDPWTKDGVTYTTGANLVVGTSTGYNPVSNVFTYNNWTPVTGSIETVPENFNMFAIDLAYLGRNDPIDVILSTNLGSYSFLDLSVPIVSSGQDFYGFILTTSGEYFTGFSISSNGSGSAPVIDNVTLGQAILDPQTKDDCKNGGWEQYGFKNQGQCVRFIETGKDSRE